ncbi:hypothetical protein B0A49_13534 [Cryomyces minteri]|uniref:Uncharacterized protein n=1 Tax=Cryomyces minteri TaxID=331657 RepID=A0A4U0VED3_9PEZI|nr:hypothetical protein B0A49_13534 [Cryomyces minteri]
MMIPKDKPSFYLYGIGQSPDRLTLGTLVYDNYATLDRVCTFPRINGCFTTKTNRKFALGVEGVDLLHVSVDFGKSRSRIIRAENGRRVILDDPEEFFQQTVLQHPEVQRKLQLWLTVAHSAFVALEAFFKKPKIYCLTGFYELERVSAKTDDGKSDSLEAGISSAVVGAATGVPVGFAIGPLANGKTIEADVFMPGPCIWAARYQQIDVEWRKETTQGKSPLPKITLRPEPVFSKYMVRAGPKRADEEAEESLDPTQSEAQVRKGDEMTMKLRGADEVMDGMEEMDTEEEKKYWKAFKKAEDRLLRQEEVDKEDASSGSENSDRNATSSSCPVGSLETSEDVGKGD